MGLFSNERKRNATATAISDVRTLVISYNELQEICLQNPVFGFQLLTLMVERLQAGKTGFANAGPSQG
jgi:CRP/FNR family transcriptional regulator, cyclic AMP receptor protein